MPKEKNKTLPQPLNSPDDGEWTFGGFSFPTTTPVPDQVFDELLYRLGSSEVVVLLYIIRRTFGFRKLSDNISLSQLCEGITTKDGRVLDRGTGLSKATVARALKSLERKGVINRTRRRSRRRGDEPTTYQLNLLTPVSHFETGGVSPARQGVSHQRDTQQTVLQQTVLQQNDLDKSKGRVESASTSSTYQPSETITLLISDLSAQTLHDPNHVEANVTQAHNIWLQSAFSEEEFVEAIQAAKRTTLEWSGSIRKQANPSTGLKNRAPYFFRVLRNLALGEED